METREYFEKVMQDYNHFSFAGGRNSEESDLGSEGAAVAESGW